MNIKPEYEIYCLYHNNVFKRYYGDQIDKITFVKMDKGSYVFKSKKHIYLQRENWFHSIGKEWAEYEFYYSLYKGYKKGLIKLPEYIGFIQYDMSFKSKNGMFRKTSIIDFVEDLIEKGKLNEETVIVFQPHPFEIIYNQNYIINYNRPDQHIDLYYENCLTTIINQCNDYSGKKMNINDFKDESLSMCGSVFIHRDVFMKVMDFISNIIEEGRLNVFNKNDRLQGGFCERYFAVYIEYLKLNKIQFDLDHIGITSNKKDKLNLKNIISIFNLIDLKTKLFFSSNFKQSLHNNFCVLLTASIDPKGCILLKRSDPKIREMDYINSLKLWLSKTNFRIVFCENSGYDLKNIRKVCKPYGDRVEIIQFDGNNYPRYLGKGYGEYRIIDKALTESKLIKETDNIVKVTGRIFIKNIYDIISSYNQDSTVGFAIENQKLQTVVCIFKLDFFNIFKKQAHVIDDSKNIYFEDVFGDSVFEINKNNQSYSILRKVKYIGYSGSSNQKYSKIYKGKNFIHVICKRYINIIINIFISVLGEIGFRLKSKYPKLYKMLKPYFPDNLSR